MKPPSKLDQIRALREAGARQPFRKVITKGRVTVTLPAAKTPTPESVTAPLRSTYAPPGQCGWCDDRRKADAARVARHRAKNPRQRRAKQKAET